MSAPTLGLAAAARACGVSVATVRRRRDALEGFGARVTPSGWVIPVPALVAVGLMPRVTPPGTPSTSGVAPATTPPDGTPLSPPTDAAEVAELRQALALERIRREAAETVAAAERRRADDLAQALRLLEPARPQALTSTGSRSKRPTWWRRRPAQ